jgi:hypothetical protein
MTALGDTLLTVHVVAASPTIVAPLALVIAFAPGLLRVLLAR